MTTPYVYLVHWSIPNKFYAGKRTAPGCSPNELFNDKHNNPYRTSQGSRTTNRRDDGETAYQYYERFGNPDFIHVVPCDDIKQASRLEEQLLIAYNAQRNSLFLNRKNGDRNWDHTGLKHSEDFRRRMRKRMTGTNHPRYGVTVSETTRKKQSDKAKIRKCSPATRDKHRQRMLGANNPNYGKPMPTETRRKISVARTGIKVTLTPEQSKRRSEMSRAIMTGRKHSNEAKERMRQAKIGKPQPGIGILRKYFNTKGRTDISLSELFVAISENEYFYQASLALGKSKGYVRNRLFTVLTFYRRFTVF